MPYFDQAGDRTAKKQMTCTPAHYFKDSVTVSTIVELNATIGDLKQTCRPAGRGRPVKLARRTIVFKGHKIIALVGEACRGSHGITMAFGLYTVESGGLLRRTTVEKIARLERFAQA